MGSLAAELSVAATQVHSGRAVPGHASKARTRRAACPVHLACRSVNDMSEAERRERQAAIQAIMLGGGGGGGGVTRADFLYALERSNPSCRWGRQAEGGEDGVRGRGRVWRVTSSRCIGMRLCPLPRKTNLAGLSICTCTLPTNALVTLGRTRLPCHLAARPTWSVTKHLRRRMAAPDAAVGQPSKGGLRCAG